MGASEDSESALSPEQARRSYKHLPSKPITINTSISSGQPLGLTETVRELYPSSLESPPPESGLPSLSCSASFLDPTPQAPEYKPERHAGSSSPSKRQRTPENSKCVPFLEEISGICPSSPPKKQKTEPRPPFARPISPPFQPDAAECLETLTIVEKETPFSVSKAKKRDCWNCRNLQIEMFDGPKDADGPRDNNNNPSADDLTVSELFQRQRQIRISRKGLKESAAVCEICAIIYRAWDATAEGLSRYMKYVCVTTTLARGILQIGGVSGGGLAQTVFGEIYTLEGERQRDLPGLSITHQVLEDELSPSRMELAKHWLDECLDNHHNCQFDEQFECQLPPRVIDIGLDGNSPCLHITNGQRGEYVTLTHSWSYNSPMKTTHSTLTARLDGFAITDMPKVYQDAIRVTHSLGYRYLWIDSLCVIQDSIQDKELATSRMHDIFGHAILNISVDCASDSIAGLITWKGRLLGKEIGRLNGDYFYVRPVYHPVDNSSRGPLLSSQENPSQGKHVQLTEAELRNGLGKNAWALQERMLSPRILHFSDYEIAWECDSYCQCECSKVPQPTGNARPFRHVLTAYNLMAEEQMVAWFQQIGRYSTLQLDSDLDKLAAISGLAEQAAKAFGLSYVSGLWQEDLIHCLMWRVTGHSSRTRVSYPSWSWASINGKITGCWDTPLLRCRDVHSRKIQQAQVLAMGSDRGLKRSDGRLNKGATQTITIKGKLAYLSGQGRNAEGEFLTEAGCLEICGSDMVLPDVSDWSEMEGAGEYYLLMLYSRQHGGDVQYECLVLKRELLDVALFPDSNVCKRVGYCSLLRPTQTEDVMLDAFVDGEICLK